MIDIPAPLAALLDGPTAQQATALRIERTDGQVYGFTSADRDVAINGVTYQADPGLEARTVELTAGLQVGNLEITTLHDGSVFTPFEVLAGVWRNAAFTLFRYDWQTPSAGTYTLLSGTVGEVELRRTTVVAELRDLRQYLQQPVGSPNSRNCRYRLGDSLCTVSLASFTFTGTLTSVTSRQVFRDSARAEALNYFTDGTITFDTGANAGLSARVKAHAADGTFTLALPLIGAVAIGDDYTVVAGCGKRLSDCVDKFDNVLNFGGEPHRPGTDAITAVPEVSV